MSGYVKGPGRRAGPAAVRGTGSSLLEQSVRSVHWKRRAGVARAIADYRNNARIKATARKCSLRLIEKAL